MLVTARTPLVLPVGTSERLEIPGVVIGGYPDPTGLLVETQLSAAAITASLGHLLDPEDFTPATWADPRTVSTHLITGTPGPYGVWVRITASDETVIRYAGRVTFT